MPDHPQLSSRWSSGTVLAAAVALGLGSGLVEVVTHMARKYGLGRILAFGNDVVWMAPLANAIIVSLVALLLLAVALVVPRLRSPGVAVALFGTAEAFGPLPAGYGPDVLPVSFFSVVHRRSSLSTTQSAP